MKGKTTFSSLIENTIVRPCISSDTPISFITMSDISEKGRVIFATTKTMRDIKSGFTFFQKNDTIIAKITPCFENGKGCFLDKIKTQYGFGSTEFLVLRAKNNIPPAFVFQLSREPHFRLKMQSLMIGSAGQQRISFSDILEYEWQHIPHDATEQQHIADILTSCDEVIEQTEKAIAKYQAIKTGMLQDLFTRGVDASGKLRPTPEEAPELYKDSPLGKIPKEWDTQPLSELVEFIRNGTTQPQTSLVTEYPVSRIETISEGIIDYQHVGYLSQNATSYKMEKGDILFSHINSLKHIGKVALKNDDKLLFHGMNLLLIRCNNKIEATFMYYLLQRKKMWFERIANSAVNQASINQTELQKIILAKPMHNEQKTILKILAPIEKIIQKEYCSLNKYISIKQGLMKRLLTPPEGALEA